MTQHVMKQPNVLLSSNTAITYTKVLLHCNGFGELIGSYG